MISIGKVTNADYYVKELSRDDAFEYYETIERPGAWQGQLAEELGLRGQVDADDFRAIVEGRNPVTGEALRSNAVKVQAFDVTASVPKSVSVMWALGDTETREHIHGALDQAQRHEGHCHESQQHRHRHRNRHRQTNHRSRRLHQRRPPHPRLLTVHKAQGMTCEHSYLLGNDGLYNELGYTGLSRAREENHLFTVASRNELGQLNQDPLADVRRGLNNN